MNNKNRLLIFANDPASANVTMAYAYLNKNKYTEILAYPINTALDIYTQHINQYITNKPIEFLTSDTIVTGTSGIDPTYELSILKKAKILNIKKTIVIVDNITNFNMRFTLDNKILEEKYLPNEIWIFNKDFKSDISYFNDKIVYKKNIYTTFLNLLYTIESPKIVHKFIKKNKYNYLVILTEYLYELYSLKFGFTEYNMLEDILKTIDILNLDIPIFLKIHPKEHKNKFNILLRKYSHLNIIQDNCNIQELIYFAKLVFGINSSVFQECNLFKKPTYSIQINSNKKMTIKTLPKVNLIYTNNLLKQVLTQSFK